MYKLIATDLDNTLLTADGEISAASADLLRQCAQKGVGLAIATGRSFASAAGMAQAAGGDYTAICYNGSLIYDPAGQKVIASAALPEDVVRGLIAFGREHDLYLQMYERDCITVEKLRLDRHPDPDLKYAKYQEVGDFLTYPYFPTPKLLIAAEPERIPELEAELGRRFRGRIYMAQSDAHLIEVMPDGVNKGTALERLADHLGLERSEIIAFGDNTNDLPLLQAAGLGVAVANAVPKLKAAAGYVTEAERNEGFDEGLRRFVLA